ncbi:betaine--homocysteine S-methyltransferase 1-like isoform X2 [Haliotis cracherodii]|uniref:betaine--homocysteine S-methyltransferase 1-like isoform X2 n=1 Tax=Haliotis cracherodii TaxID=6455 RepID=UPI0039ED2F31
MTSKSLLQRLQDKEDIVVAEGYLFEFERRGLLKAGAFVPEVVIERPDLVKNLHEEFVNAGSDVCLAFTYYGHREKLRVIGREGDLEKLNRDALKIARQVADDTGTLMAGDLCNTTVYRKDNKEAIETTEAMFKEQIEWAVEEGADYVVGESFSELGEAMLALECINKYGNGLPAVISFISHAVDNTSDGLAFGVACRRLEEAGAAAVGLNCGRGPKTMLPLIREIRQACKERGLFRLTFLRMPVDEVKLPTLPEKPNPWACSMWDYVVATLLTTSGWWRRNMGVDPPPVDTPPICPSTLFLGRTKAARILTSRRSK